MHICPKGLRKYWRSICHEWINQLLFAKLFMMESPRLFGSQGKLNKTEFWILNVRHIFCDFIAFDLVLL